MAILKNRQTGQLLPLRSTHTIGRSRRCDLHIGRREVSALHATLRWTDTGWMLRDHSSRNGTWHQGVRLGEEAVSLSTGDALAFGVEAADWILLSTSPPEVTAVPLEGEPISAVRGLLVLPDDDNPMVSIFRDAIGQWIRESAEGSQPVADGEVITIDGRQWRLELPDTTEATWEPSQPEPTLSTVEFQFAVSPDEEYVALTAQHRDQSIDLGSRNHNYTLLTLARLRLQDQDDSDLEAPHHGWVHMDELCQMLKQTEQSINLDVFRIRRQLGKAGIDDAAGVIERRAYHKTLRFGSRRVSVVSGG